MSRLGHYWPGVACWIFLQAVFILEAHSEVWKSARMMKVVCDQERDYQSSLSVPKSIKQRPSENVCGWFTTGPCGDMCGTVVYHWPKCEQNSTAATPYWHLTEEGKFVLLQPSEMRSWLFPVDSDIKFHLALHSNPIKFVVFDISDQEALKLPEYVKRKPLKILIHGFFSSAASFGGNFVKAYAKHFRETNVIAVDWSIHASAPTYYYSAKSTATVGQKTARLIKKLVDQELVALDQVHLVGTGHSLGAHVAGSAGSFISRWIQDSKIGRITVALDPARPLFSTKPDEDRIDPGDAAFVDVIHTAGGSLGFAEARGHADFYPNSGKAKQPGCGFDLLRVCSHSRAHKFMVESIGNPEAFLACQCSSWEAFKSKKCDCVNDHMGEHVLRSARGTYYLETNSKVNFSKS